MTSVKPILTAADFWQYSLDAHGCNATQLRAPQVVWKLAGLLVEKLALDAPSTTMTNVPDAAGLPELEGVQAHVYVCFGYVLVQTLPRSGRAFVDILVCEQIDTEVIKQLVQELLAPRLMTEQLEERGGQLLPDQSS